MARSYTLASPHRQSAASCFTLHQPHLHHILTPKNISLLPVPSAHYLYISSLISLPYSIATYFHPLPTAVSGVTFLPPLLRSVSNPVTTSLLALSPSDIYLQWLTGPSYPTNTFSAAVKPYSDCCSSAIPARTSPTSTFRPTSPFPSLSRPPFLLRTIHYFSGASLLLTSDESIE